MTAHGGAWRAVLTVPRSLVRQTFSRYGLYYVRYMVHAIRLRPAQIVRIFTMAIQGHHTEVAVRIGLGDREVSETIRSRIAANLSS